MATKICQGCNQSFVPKRKGKIQNLRDKRIYCSRKCCGIGKRKKRISVNCLICKKQFFKHRSWFYDGRKHYCSRACQGIAKRKAKFNLTKDGYWRKKSLGGQTTQHVEIAENVLGRKLKIDECVHHINGNPSDNRNSNLLICKRGYHSWLHWKMSKLYQQEHFV